MSPPPAADPEASPHSPVPPPAPLSMPIQDLRKAPRRPVELAHWQVYVGRLVAFGGALALAAFGIRQILLVLQAPHFTPMQWLFVVLFTLTFAWIAFSATSATAGLLLRPMRREPGGGRLTSRTAIVMPVYQEDPALAFATLQALSNELVVQGHGEAFELFVLSDSRDPNAWARETTAFAALRAALGDRMAAWYRRRADNRGRKAGNVQDFVERWGDRYDHMLVLDADSLMEAATVVEMVRRMEAEPRLGLLQTVPVLAFGATPYAALQQFAGRVYGPVVARGVAAWQGHDGNFWGHNAIIRVRAFAEACGLPVLPGRKPFGGHVMSHDFVEAALLRRAGWWVRMDTDLHGSFEGAPPSLLDAAARDRRWAQGNLQHLQVIAANGLRWPSRVHFGIGIGSYLASPLWLLLLLVGLTLTLQANLYGHEYFSDRIQLFPNWPRFDAERMRQLFALSMLLLFWPKLMGLAAALLDAGTRARFGGAGRLVASSMVEVVVSSLLAPLMMLLQTRHLVEIVLGRDSGWAPQQRAGSRLPWLLAWRAHGAHVAIGALSAIGIAMLQPGLLVWLSPVLAGLVLAPVLSRASGDARLGELLARRGLLRTPEDRTPPTAFRASEAAAVRLRDGMAPDVAGLAIEPTLVHAHLATLDTVEPRPETLDATLARVTARAKIEAASSPAEAVGWLTKAEAEALLASPELLRALDSRRHGPTPTPQVAAA